MAVMAPKHPLAQKPYAEAEDFATERFITYGSIAMPGFEWERFFKPAGTAPNLVSRLSSPEATIDLIRAGYGVSILSQWAVRPEVAAGTLAAIPLGPNGFSVDWWIVFMSASKNDAVLEFAEILRASSARHGVGLNVVRFGGDPSAL